MPATAIGMVALAVYQLRGPATLAGSTAIDPPLNGTTVARLARAWLPLLAEAVTATIVAFLVPDTLQAGPIRAGLPRFGVVIGDEAAAAPVPPGVGTLLALAGSLVRWRRAFGLSLIRRGSRRGPAATQLGWVADVVPLESAEGLGSNGTRAP